MSEQDPKPIEIPQDPEQLMAYEVDPQREATVRNLDLSHEIEAMLVERDELIEEIQGGRGGEEARKRLSQLKQDLLAAQADKIDQARNSGGQQST
jgi:hypothetical protein